MKKVIAMLLSTAMLLSLAACGEKEQSDTTEGVSSVTEDTSTQNNETSAQKIEVEKELFDVVLTIPADMMKDATQESLDQTVSEGNVHSAVLNEDGSVTYEMSKRQHKKMMDELATAMDETIDGMVGSEDYPNITKIESNKDYTHFTVTTKSAELDMDERFSVLMFYFIGGTYGTFNGDAEVEVSVDYVNADSGEIIHSANSADVKG